MSKFTDERQPGCAVRLQTSSGLLIPNVSVKNWDGSFAVNRLLPWLLATDPKLDKTGYLSWPRKFDPNSEIVGGRSYGGKSYMCFTRCLQLWYATDEPKKLSSVEYNVPIGVAGKEYTQVVE